MSVELRALRWAIIAAQHKSRRRAAETLNIRQSTLSRGLRDLEHQLGAILFERTNGGTRPTLAGEEFLDAARRIIKEAEAIAARVKMRSRGESGRLTIGVHASLSAGNLRATLIEHRRRFPEVHTHLVDGSSNDLISNLANSNIDVAFVAGDNATWDGRSLMARPCRSSRDEETAGFHPWSPTREHGVRFRAPPHSRDRPKWAQTPLS